MACSCRLESHFSLSHTQIKKIRHFVQEMPTQRVLTVSSFLSPPFFQPETCIKADPAHKRNLLWTILAIRGQKEPFH